jgi:hypothetical protein
MDPEEEAVGVHRDVGDHPEVVRGKGVIALEQGADPEEGDIAHDREVEDGIIADHPHIRVEREEDADPDVDQEVIVGDH